MKGKQRAKFFCENCGAEVPADARVCKNCGRFFSSVRCPACGATGSASKFAKGCPVCGYATDSGTFNISAYSEEEKEEVRRRLTGAEQKKIKGAFAAYERKHARGSGSALPFWVYAVTLAVFLGVITAVVKLMR
ncbi:zinc ribbon domain-containing protein [Treponema socranskii]|uniref:zinc ribbon domain-containing protein n=1 Tax=Treponema socranskii TaxID=53419 RepID=UPI0028E19461|nr:zinc ribbon domain-containing protein [Treponema socranskii]